MSFSSEPTERAHLGYDPADCYRMQCLMHPEGKLNEAQAFQAMFIFRFWVGLMQEADRDINVPNILHSELLLRMLLGEPVDSRGKRKRWKDGDAFARQLWTEYTGEDC